MLKLKALNLVIDQMGDFAQINILKTMKNKELNF